MTSPFPTDWSHALILVAHPDDPEYGLAPAVSAWTRAGRTVTYILATSGEAGFEGMSPEEAGPLREREQIRAGSHVGVHDIEFLGLPDSRLDGLSGLAGRISEAMSAHPDADLIVSLYRGAEWAPGVPNQSDHIAFGRAAVEAAAPLGLWHFENGPEPTHHVDVTPEDVQAAIESLAEHEVYLRVLDPSIPVAKQARERVLSSVIRDGATIRVGLRLIAEPPRP